MISFNVSAEGEGILKLSLFSWELHHHFGQAYSPLGVALCLLGQATSYDGYEGCYDLETSDDSLRKCLFLKKLRVMCFLPTGTAPKTKCNVFYNDGCHCFNSNVVSVFIFPFIFAWVLCTSLHCVSFTVTFTCFYLHIFSAHFACEQTILAN